MISSADLKQNNAHNIQLNIIHVNSSPTFMWRLLNIRNLSESTVEINS